MMHKMSLALLASVVAAGSLLAVETRAQSPAGTTTMGNFTLSVDLLLMARTRGGNAALTVDSGENLGDPTRDSPTNFDALQNGPRPGVAIGGRYRFAPMQAITTRAFILGEFGGESTFTYPGEPTANNINMAYVTPPNSNTVFATNTVNTGNSQSIFALRTEARSALFGVEANYERGLVSGAGWSLQGFVGPRYMLFRDRLKTTAFDEQNDFLGTDNDIDRVTIRLNNHLVGGQIGVQGRYNLTQTLFLDAHVSGGLYANLVRRHRQFSSDDNAANGFVDDLSTTRFAQGVDGKIMLTWMPMPAVTVGIGIQAIWLNNVAVAQTQFIAAANGNDRDARANSNVLFYGGVLRGGFRF